MRTFIASMPSAAAVALGTAPAVAAVAAAVVSHGVLIRT
jgi:hypothetical protein